MRVRGIASLVEFIVYDEIEISSTGLPFKA